jgi:hypothetical protein
VHALLPSDPWRLWDLVGDRRGLDEEPPARPMPRTPRRLPPCPTCGHAPILDDEDPQESVPRVP